MYGSINCATYSSYNNKRYSTSKGEGYFRTHETDKYGEYVMWDCGLKLFVAREIDTNLDGKIDRIEIYYNGIQGRLIETWFDKDGDGEFETRINKNSKK
jgi:hypothetical protein